MTARVGFAFLAATLLAAVLVAPGTSAGKPTSERIAIDDTFVDDFLSDACGVTVTTRALGHIILRTFPDGSRTSELTTINIGLTATAGGNTYRFRDVGADLLRITPDGTAILSIIGQVPFDFTGVLKIDLETGEAILEPHHDTSDRVDRACAALTA
jgi:hypothetical protein